jgi:hypothetical protein
MLDIIEISENKLLYKDSKFVFEYGEEFNDLRLMTNLLVDPTLFFEDGVDYTVDGKNISFNNDIFLDSDCLERLNSKWNKVTYDARITNTMPATFFRGDILYVPSFGRDKQHREFLVEYDKYFNIDVYSPEESEIDIDCFIVANNNVEDIVENIAANDFCLLRNGLVVEESCRFTPSIPFSIHCDLGLVIFRDPLLTTNSVSYKSYQPKMGNIVNTEGAYMHSSCLLTTTEPVLTTYCEGKRGVIASSSDYVLFTIVEVLGPCMAIVNYITGDMVDIVSGDVRIAITISRNIKIEKSEVNIRTFLFFTSNVDIEKYDLYNFFGSYTGVDKLTSSDIYRRLIATIMYLTQYGDISSYMEILYNCLCGLPITEYEGEEIKRIDNFYSSELLNVQYINSSLITSIDFFNSSYIDYWVFIPEDGYYRILSVVSSTEVVINRAITDDIPGTATVKLYSRECWTIVTNKKTYSPQNCFPLKDTTFVNSVIPMNTPLVDTIEVHQDSKDITGGIGSTYEGYVINSHPLALEVDMTDSPFFCGSYTGLMFTPVATEEPCDFVPMYNLYLGWFRNNTLTIEYTPACFIYLNNFVALLDRFIPLSTIITYKEKIDILPSVVEIEPLSGSSVWILDVSLLGIDTFLGD